RLNPIANMTVVEGATADQVISGASPDGSPLTFTKASGPTFMTVTTIDPGTGTATGNIHLAPALVDAGTYAATVSMSGTSCGGLVSVSRSFTITVTPECNRPPLLNAIA